MGTENESQRRIVEKAMRDPAFRSELVASPKQTIERELGMTLPADIQVIVIEEQEHQVHIVLPPAPFQAEHELSDDELQSLAGGHGCHVTGTRSWFCTAIRD